MKNTDKVFKFILVLSFLLIGLASPMAYFMVLKSHIHYIWSIIPLIFMILFTAIPIISFWADGVDKVFKQDKEEES